MHYPSLALFTVLKNKTLSNKNVDSNILIISKHFRFNKNHGEVKFANIVLILKSILKLN